MSRYDPYDPPGPTPEPWGRETSLGPSPSVQVTMRQMTDRMQTVIDAAERAADAIRRDAEEQARRHLAEAQRQADRMTAERVRLIAELTDDLIRRAAIVRDGSDQMVRAIETAIGSVAVGLPGPPPEPPRAPQPAQPAGPESVSRAALLHATRLAVAGRDREEIAGALRDEHGIDRPGPVVDRVLGQAESP